MHSLPCLDPKLLFAGKFFPMSNLSPAGSVHLTENSHLHPHHAHDNDSLEICKLEFSPWCFSKVKNSASTFYFSPLFRHRIFEETIKR